MVQRSEPTILHADLDSFYASVEQRDHPHLLGRPVVVGHGVILAASYEAKACGVRTAMSGWRARALCPEVIAVDPHFAAYTAASRAVFKIFRDTTPLVEGISIDEAFLDVGGLRRIAGSPAAIADVLRRRVAAEVGLPITVGGACTKFLAKVASAVAKPDGLLIVPAGGEMEFLHPLPVERLWGVGKVTSVKLRSAGITTVGELAAIDQTSLTSIIGSGAAHHLSALAHARDPRQVVVGVRRSSIGSQCALGRRRKAPGEVDAVLLGLVDRVTRRMRTADRRGRTVVLRLRFDDFTRATRSHTLSSATASAETVLAVARDLYAQARPLIADRGLTMVGIAVTGFDGLDSEQLQLPFDHPGRPARAARHQPEPQGAAPALDRAMDRVRQRFGTAAVTRATLLHGRSGLEMPMLPD